MKIESRYHDPPLPREQKAVQGLRGGAAVFMVAAFESFLKQTVSEHLSHRLSRKPPIQYDNLPQEMRVRFVYGALERAMNESASGNSGSKCDRLRNIELACEMVLNRVLDVTLFCDTRSNPASSVVKGMFADLGIRNIFEFVEAGFQRELQAQYRGKLIGAKLDEIVNRRHVVAHTADALTISRVDLEEAVRFLMALAAALDSDVGKFIKAY